MNNRHEGLDLARFLAFAGMVIVNFRIVMMQSEGDGINNSLAGMISGALEGRAAATFVVLAGIGLGLAATRYPLAQIRITTIKRAFFLLALGLLNCTIFDADILHYYAVYFLLAVPLLSVASRRLIPIIVALAFVFVAMAITLDYDAGWNWSDYSYSDFWTAEGFIRNLFFNGWHPVIPWLGFLLFGIVLSRLPLSERPTQIRMMVLGAAASIAAELIHWNITFIGSYPFC